MGPDGDPDERPAPRFPNPLRPAVEGPRSYTLNGEAHDPQEDSLVALVGHRLPGANAGGAGRGAADALAGALRPGAHATDGSGQRGRHEALRDGLFPPFGG